MRAPLTEPGSEVRVGEYLLAVNGQDVSAEEDLYRFFEGTAGKPTRIRVGPDAGGAGAREITVTPVANETSLRQWAWTEQNRRQIDRQTGGRVAYIYIPDTLGGGYSRFNREFYAQIDKEAVILDARFNLGGALPDAIIFRLGEPVLSRSSSRDQPDGVQPLGIHGPKVMLINEYASSGGDALAWYFRQHHLGPLIGKRTRGGLCGAFDIPELMDGSVAEVPTVMFWGADGQWGVDNRGVGPDIEVEFDPAQVRQGRDPQLEKAIAVVMELLRKHPPVHPHRPSFPDARRRASQASRR